ncbi:MAG TPA: hypothetical protein VE338_07390 [Ktedonobacterales bacterium]|nr:hypothetical protein [Ktedonobacterales bacterium]
MRQRNRHTALFALTFWLAGAITVASQPLRHASGQITGALYGSVSALLLYDFLVVAWGMSGALLVTTQLWPLPSRNTGAVNAVSGAREAGEADTNSGAAPQRLRWHVTHGPRAPTEPPVAPRRSLRVTIQWVALINGGVFLALLALLPSVAHDSWVLREGVWFPVAPGMAPAPLLYDLIGKLYLLTLIAWACVACWQASQRLPHRILRIGAFCGMLVAIGMMAQSIAVTIAQWQRREYFAGAEGRLDQAVWLTLGLTLPLAAFFTAGLARRWQQRWLARDLQALARRLSQSAVEAGHADAAEVRRWATMILGDQRAIELPSTTREVTHQQHYRQAVRARVLSRVNHFDWRNLLWQPFATAHTEVDRLTIFIHDVLRAYYPLPNQATALAAAWLWRQPVQRLARLDERSLALLLLAATIAGGEANSFAPLPLDYPTPLARVFPTDRSWGNPASAPFLRSLWHLLNGLVDRTISPIAREGLAAVQHLLDDAIDAERAALTNAWLAQMEETEAEMEETARHDDASPREPQHASAIWWIPPTWHASDSRIATDDAYHQTTGDVGRSEADSIAQGAEVSEDWAALAAADDDSASDDAGDDEAGPAEVAE